MAKMKEKYEDNEITKEALEDWKANFPDSLKKDYVPFVTGKSSKKLKEILKQEDYREITVNPKGKVLGRRDLGRFEEINMELSETEKEQILTEEGLEGEDFFNKILPDGFILLGTAETEITLTLIKML